jgi:predicted kinase
MRKWMRERLQRRKKKATEQPNHPAPPPLQPAYFDADETHADQTSAGQIPSQASESSQSHVEAGDTAEPKSVAQKESSGAQPVELTTQPREQKSSGADAQRGRGRRRRGGRGGGGRGRGRGREQAVAQAFAPAAGKGIVPEIAPDASEVEASAIDAGALDTSESPVPEVAEPEEVESGATTPEAAIPVPAPQAPEIPAAIPVAPPRPPKGIVVLAIGLPGSGKSSWFKRHNLTPLSSDLLRSLLFDDVREQRFQDLVFSNLRSMLKARLIAKRPMNYVDATNLTPQERQHWIKLAKDYNYEVHAVFFDVPLEVCIERHQRRDRVVPEDVMRRMAAKLKPPSFEEGFAKITVVRVKKKEG